MKTKKPSLLALLCLFSVLLAACAPAPQKVIDAWQEALNNGNIDDALSLLAEDAVVTVVSPGPEGDGIYNGHAEIRDWYETMAASKGSTTLSGCKADGDTITCLDTYSDEGLKSMGVDFIEGQWVAIVSKGKIQSYTVTITPESLAKFPPPPAAEVRLTTAEAIAGRWKANTGNYVVLHEFRANSTVIVNVQGIGLISSGPFSFEDDLLKFDDRNGDCVGMVGRYEVYGTYEGDRLVQLRFVLVGEDSCSDRRETLDGNTMTPG